MYYFLSALSDPYPVLLLSMGAMLLLARKGLHQQPKTRRVLTAVWFGLVIYSLPVTSFLAAATLEWQLPADEPIPEEVTTIVVLGGYVDTRAGRDKSPHFGEDMLYRCLKASELYRERNDCLVVVSGGRMPPSDESDPSIASAASDLLVRLGVPRDKILLEEHSTSTYENAVETKKLLDARQITNVALVTEAIHLPRSAWCFQSQGIQIQPFGCESRTRHFEWSWRQLLPTAQAAHTHSQVWHEWVGIAWYAARGYFHEP